MTKKRSFGPKVNENFSNSLTKKQQQSDEKLQRSNHQKNKSKKKSSIDSNAKITASATCNQLSDSSKPSKEVQHINNDSAIQFAGDNKLKQPSAEERKRAVKWKNDNERELDNFPFNQRNGIAKEVGLTTVKVSSKKRTSTLKEREIKSCNSSTQVEQKDFFELAKSKSTRGSKKFSNKNLNSTAFGVKLCRKKNLIINFSASGFSDKLFNLLQIFNDEFLSKISFKISEFWLWMGTKMQKTFGLLWEMYRKNTQSEPQLRAKHILLLTTSIRDLNLQLQQTKQENNEKIGLITGEFDKIYKQLLNIQEQNRVRMLSVAQPALCCTPIPPPPPPPPPPKLPSLILSPPKRSIVVLNNKTELNDTRPIISLDDILKVKLRKISNRPISSKTESEILNNLKMQLKPSRTRSPLYRSQWGSIISMAD